MDTKQKAEFVRKMGKKLPKYSKGGLIRRLGNLHYFDDGGTVLGGRTTSGGNSTPTVNNHGLVGTIGNLLGLNNQFQAQGAELQYGTNAGQLNQAYQGAQSGINQQQAFADQLYGQGQQGMNTQNALAGQLQGIINGTGPNAAQAALNQNTMNNVAQTSAMAAGQRGASSNAGLLARQAGMMGSNAQQQAAGQAATLQAQQQIAAQQQLQNLAQSQIGQQAGAIQGVNNAQQNEQNILQGANTAANNAAVTMQSNINNVNSGVAAQNQQAAANTLHGVMGVASNIPVVGGMLGGGFAKGGEVPHMAGGGGLTVAPEPTVGMQGQWLVSAPVPAGSASAGETPALPKLTTPATQKEKKPATLEESKPNQKQVDKDTANSLDLATKQDLSNSISTTDASGTPVTLSASPDYSQMAMYQAHGGEIHHSHYDNHFMNYFGGGQSEKVPAMVSPDEIYLSPEKVRQVVEEGANPMKIGEKIKGKARVKDDSLKNDTVHKTLEEGGVVIPRHITKHKMAPEKAELFVHRAIARKRARG